MLCHPGNSLFNCSLVIIHRNNRPIGYLKHGAAHADQIYQHDFSLERIVSLYSFAIISEIATSAASPLIAIRPLSSITQSK